MVVLFARAVPIALFLGGCDVPLADTHAPDPPAPSEWHYTDEAPINVPLAADALGVAFGGALAEVMTFDPAFALNLYDALTTTGDASCPWYDPTFTAQRYWSDDCETAAGVEYYGWALYDRRKNMRQGELFCTDNAFLYSFSHITEPGVASFTGYGELDLAECTTNSGEASFYALYRGAFRDDGASGTWLSRPLSLSLDVNATEGAAGRTLGLSGSVAGLSGELPAVYFHDVAVVDTVCALEPSGWIWAMDAAETTYELRFDDVCDGCGALTIAGESAGTACVDVSAALAWEGRPWG